MPETPEAIRGLADTMITRFTPPSFVPGCEVKSIADIDEYTTNNGWIEAIVGGDNQQRVRYYGTPQGVAVNDFVDVEYFPAYKLYRVFGSTLGGTASVGGVRVNEVWEKDFGNVAVYTDNDGNIGIGTASPDYNLQVGDGAPSISISSANNTVFIGPDTSSGRLILEGTSQADIVIIDGGGGSNDKVMQLVTDGGITKFRSLSDAAGIQTDDILAMDHSNGNVGIGSASPPELLYVEGGGISVTGQTYATSGNMLITSSAALGPRIVSNTDTAGNSTVTAAASRIQYGAGGAAISTSPTTTAGNPRTFTQRTVVTIAGDMGIGASTPQGRLHGYDTISGFLHWKYDGLDATSRTIIPNGTGDVLYRLAGIYVMRNSAGVAVSGSVAVANGGTQNITVGADTVTITVAAAGTVTIARSAGANTIKVGLWLLWL